MRRKALLVLLLASATFAHAQSFRGPYVGGTVAAGSADAHWDISTGRKVDHTLSGGLIGVQGGYNWQPGGWLLGVQADLGAGLLDGSSRCPNPTFECTTELLSLFTLRGRAGPVFDNYSLYATGGIASAGIRTKVDNHAGSHDDDLQAHVGWTAGFGVAWMLARHVQMQAEYLHASFGSENHVMQGLNTAVKLKADFFRIGAHYKF